MIERFQKIIGFWVNLHPMLRFVLGIGFLSLVGWGLLKPSYKVAKEWWYGRQLKQAQQAIESGDMQQARDLSQTILRAGDPRVIEALRVLERSMSALRDPNRVQIANALMFHPKGDLEDRLRGFLLNVEESPLGWVGQVWAHMDKSNHTDRRFALPFAERLLENGKLAEVIAVVQGLENWDNDWQTQTLIMKALIANDQTDSLTQAQEKFDGWWPVDKHESGLDLLESIPVLKLNVALLPKSIERLNPIVPRDALMLARMQYVDDKWTRLEVVNQAIGQWKGAAPLDLAKFLYASGMRYRLFSEFPPEETAKHAGMLAMQLEACAQENEWSLALRYLNACENQMEKVIFYAWKSAILEKMQAVDDLESVQRELASAVSSSALTNVQLQLAQVMKLANLPGRANAYMLEAIGKGKGALPLFADIGYLIESLYAQGLEKSLMEVLASYLLFEPSNPMLVTHYCYLACISKSCDPKVLVDAIQPLAKAFPESPHIHAVLAAIHLACGDFSNAQKEADLVKVDLQQLAPGYRAAVVVARFKAGAIKADDPLLGDIPWSNMMPVEARFYRSFSEPEKVDSNAAEGAEK